MSKQIEVWEGEFGKAYTERNQVDWHKRVPAFRAMVGDLNISSVLEVGCNRGHNLLALAEVLGPETDILGVEPNRFALAEARKASPTVTALRGTALDLPFKDGTFDLVFTAGVLIHIGPRELPIAIREITRVSRRYLLAVEYFAEHDTEISYRGNQDLLWKRNFLAHYQASAPGLRQLKTGFWGQEDGFDATTWWLMEK